jgi:O-methyltransferase
MNNQEFCHSICQQVVSAVASGKRHIVLWGFTEECVTIMSQLKSLGILDSCVSGIIDSSADKVGVTLFGHTVSAPQEIGRMQVDVLVVTSDQHKEEVLRDFSRNDRRIPQVIMAGTAHFEFHEPDFEQILDSCLVKSYANGYENSLIHIYQSIKYLAAHGVTGNIAEFGIFKGGTITFIAKALQHFGLSETKIYGFDIFEGFPPRRSVLDLYSNPKCEFKDHAAVQAHCHQLGIEVIKGDICETYKVLEGVPLMLSFFDTDNYSPPKAALELCYQQTVRGGVLAFDHLISEERFVYTIGERMAAHEVLGDKGLFHLHGTGIFLKL